MNPEPAPAAAVASPPKPSIFPAFLATVIAAATGLAFWWLHWHLQDEPTPKHLEEWSEFLGLSHPLAVHFPVACILLVALLGIVGGKNRKHDGAIRWLLWVNLLTAAAGILFGHFSGLDFAEGKLRNHLLTGLAVGGWSYLALFFFLIRSGPITTGLYRLSISAAVVAVTLAGHFGATLTHGEIFDTIPWRHKEKDEKKESAGPSKVEKGAGTAAVASPPASPAPPAPPPANANNNKTAAGNTAANVNASAGGNATDEKPVFQTVIVPILNARCVSCHGEKKQKGEIRLDSYEALFHKGESGKPSFVAKSAGDSESIYRMELATEEDDHMPPAKKPQHTAEELLILKWWINEGASKDALIKTAPPDLIERIRATAAQPPQPADA